MKRKILSLFLCSVMLMGSVCGCESKTDEQSSSSKVVHVDGTISCVSEKVFFAQTLMFTGLYTNLIVFEIQYGMSLRAPLQTHTTSKHLVRKHRLHTG